MVSGIVVTIVLGVSVDFDVTEDIVVGGSVGGCVGFGVSVWGGPGGSVSGSRVSVIGGSTDVVSGNVVAIVLVVSVDLDVSGEFVVGDSIGGCLEGSVGSLVAMSFGGWAAHRTLAGQSQP